MNKKCNDCINYEEDELYCTSDEYEMFRWCHKNLDMDNEDCEGFKRDEKYCEGVNQRGCYRGIDGIVRRKY